MRIILLLIWLIPTAARAADGFLHGYVSAYLDELGLVGHAVTVESTAEPGVVRVTGRACLDEPQRRMIEERLRRSGRLARIDWQLTCAAAIVPAAYRVVSVDNQELAFLPEALLFKPLYADPREARFGMRIQQHRLEGGSFLAADIALGATLGLASGNVGNTAWQLGLQGAVFALFDLDAASTDLVNTDYWIGIPVGFRSGNWSLRLRLYHQSGHLGDEYILRDRLGTRRLNISYETLDGVLAYEWDSVRLFAGGGYILHSLHDHDRGQLQYGLEYRRPHTLGAAALVVATYFQHLEHQDWHLNQSYRLGLAVERGVREAGVMLAHYDGYSPDGQFYTLRLKYSGLEVFYRF